MATQKRGREFDSEARAAAQRAAKPGGPTPQLTGTADDPRLRQARNPALEGEWRDLALEALDNGSADEPDVGQEIDGGLSAQPKSNLSGGFEPGGERLVSAITQGGPGGIDGTDPAASGMSVVADPDAPLDEQIGARDATPYETGEAPLVWAQRGTVPLPEQDEGLPDDTRGSRPPGTPEAAIDQRKLTRAEAYEGSDRAARRELESDEEADQEADERATDEK